MPGKFLIAHPECTNYEVTLQAPEKYAEKEAVCYCTVGYISGGACKYLRNKVTWLFVTTVAYTFIFEKNH